MKRFRLAPATVAAAMVVAVSEFARRSDKPANQAWYTFWYVVLVKRFGIALM